MKTIQVSKGEVLQTLGVLNSKIYHVHEGLLRSYSIDEKGKEHIFMFAPEGWTIADTNGPEVPTVLYIDCLEDSIVSIYEKVLQREEKNVGPLVKRLSVLQERVIMLMSSSAIERYEHFVKTYPEIVQRVPQRMIASYLGITPEALSKVKNKRSKKSS
ncbi:MAG: Crp/Fnr family transcriptional regulator [Balneola sp.]|nr:MAG: Crp/Fnr family transcriptional regulator [Balneola sp.]